MFPLSPNKPVQLYLCHTLYILLWASHHTKLQSLGCHLSEKSSDHKQISPPVDIPVDIYSVNFVTSLKKNSMLTLCLIWNKQWHSIKRFLTIWEKKYEGSFLRIISQIGKFPCVCCLPLFVPQKLKKYLFLSKD